MTRIIGRIKKLDFLLGKEYGKKVWKPRMDPLSELLATILSQNTSDNNSHRAFANLLDSFKNWEQVRGAPKSRIVMAIKSGGLAEIKAERIKNILNQIYKETSHTDLSFLKKWKTEKIKNYLKRFKGVGEKTIACVLMFSLGRAVMPVDTHVMRLSKRLGLIPRKADFSQAHITLQKLVPDNLMYQFHLNLIEHGRKVCKAQNPLCEICVLFKVCNAEEKLSLTRSKNNGKN